MTSKEAINKVKHCGVEEIRIAMEQIEKDLEVLEILKDIPSIRLKIQDWCDIYPVVTYPKERKKVKEWLKND